MLGPSNEVERAVRMAEAVTIETPTRGVSRTDFSWRCMAAGQSPKVVEAELVTAVCPWQSPRLKRTIDWTTIS